MIPAIRQIPKAPKGMYWNVTFFGSTVILKLYKRRFFGIMRSEEARASYIRQDYSTVDARDWEKVASLARMILQNREQERTLQEIENFVNADLRSS